MAYSTITTMKKGDLPPCKGERRFNTLELLEFIFLMVAAPALMAGVIALTWLGLKTAMGI